MKKLAVLCILGFSTLTGIVNAARTQTNNSPVAAGASPAAGNKGAAAVRQSTPYTPKPRTAPHAYSISTPRQIPVKKAAAPAMPAKKQ